VTLLWPLWLSYVAGAVASLLWKLAAYVDEGGTAKHFFLRSRDSQATTVVIFGSAWLVGALSVRAFSGEIEALGFFAGMPPHPVLFLLGALAEVIAPTVAKWVIDGALKLFGGGR
jgi:hypothetical protein